MTRTGLFCISTLFVLLIGCFPCRAKECTAANIINCEWDNQNNNDCAFYKKIVACLNRIDECTDDELKEKLEDEKKINTNKVNQCPGLEDGMCFYNYLNSCEHFIPYKIKYNSISDAEKQTACNQFKGKSSVATNCFEDIKRNCTARGILMVLDSHIAGVKEIDGLCGF